MSNGLVDSKQEGDFSWRQFGLHVAMVCIYQPEKRIGRLRCITCTKVRHIMAKLKCIEEGVECMAHAWVGLDLNLAWKSELNATK